MTVIKMKVAAAVVALAVLGTGIAWGARAGGSGSDGDSSARPEPVAANAALPAPAPAAEPTAARAEEEEQPRERERPATAPALNGLVVSVAKDGKSFTVSTPPTDRGGESPKTTVKLADKAAVTFNGVRVGEAKPTAGYQAQVWFEGNSKDVAATVVFTAFGNQRRGIDVVGTVVAGKDNKSVTLERRPMERGAEPPKETIPFDDKTVLAFSNVGKDGAKITAGMLAAVSYADDGKTAGKVMFSAPVEGRGREEKRPEVMGKVMRADDKSIVVEMQPAERGGEPTRVTISTDKATATFNNVPLDGAKAAPGMQALVWLADGSKDAAARVVFVGTVPERWTTISGKVVAVAKNGNSVTLEQLPTARGEEPKRVEIKLTAKTKLLFFGVGPDGAKLAEGLTADARLLDGSADTASQVILTKPGPGRGR